MGRMLSRAIEAAGMGELAERALSGAGLDEADMARVREADLLIVAGLADAVRARHRGDEVQLYDRRSLGGAGPIELLDLDVGRPDGPTGQEALLAVAHARLSTPADRAVAVDYEQIGLELAQTALAFGADALYGELSGKRTLPLLDGPAARQREIEGLIERGGKRVRWCFGQQTAAAAQGSQPRSRS